MTFRTQARRGFEFQLHPKYSLQTYTKSLITAYGGAEWPLNDVNTEVIVNNRANTDTTSVVELLTNGDLETWTTSTNAGTWTESVTALSTINQETSIVHGGSNAAKFIIDSINSSASLTQAVAGAIGKTYKITYWVRVDSTTGSPTHRVDFSSIGGPAGALTTSYVQFSTRRVSTSATPTIILNRNSAANRTIYWDDISVVEDGDGDMYISLTGLTMAQTGEGGIASSAIDFNGSAGVLTLPNRADWQGMTDFFYAGILNPDVTGANDRIVFKSGEYDVIFNSDGTISVTVNYSSSNATCTTSTTFSTGAWQGFAFGISNTDKLPKVYKNGNECAYTSQVAGVGTRVSNTNNIQWFKDASTNGFDGKAQKLALIKTPPTTTLVGSLYSRRMY